MRAVEELLAFGEHRRSVAPNAHLPFFTKFVKDYFKRGDSIVVVFEEQESFHAVARFSSNTFECAEFSVGSVADDKVSARTLIGS